MNLKYKTLFGGLLMALLLAGCGGNKQEEQTGASGAQGNGDDAAAAGPAREIVIQANDQMQFDITEFTVESGERVRLVLKNIGTMPKFSMGHNVVILQQNVNSDTFADRAMNAPATDYIPPNSENQVLAHTKLLGGGEEDSITFTVPRKKGDYVYICSFPGHYQIGMKGIMKVQ